MSFCISSVVCAPSVGRQDFKLPAKWPVNAFVVMQANLKVGRAAVVRSALDHMANCAAFVELVAALRSDDCWFKPEAQEVALYGEKRALLRSAVVLGKILLHVCYNLSTGELLQNDLAHLLSVADLSFTSPVITELVIPDTYFTESLTELSVWSALRAHLAETIKAIVFPTQHVPVVVEEETSSVHDSLQWTTDSIAAVLRSIVGISGAIQVRHMSVMRFSKTMPKKAEFPLVRKMDKSTTQEQQWRNYIADLALMWLLIRNMTDALQAMDITEFIAVVQRARFWSVSACLVKSSRALHWEKACRKYLLDVESLSLKLHNLYIRLATLCLGMSKSRFKEDLLADAWSSLLTTAFGRIHMRRRPVEHVPGATLVDRVFWWTHTASADKFGLADPTSGDSFLCCVETDYEVTLAICAIAMSVTKTEPHLWVAVTDVRGWNSLERLLPPIELIRKRCLAPQLAWGFTEGELDSQKETFSKSAESVKGTPHAL